jgi:arabinofuranosyltransferase
VVGPHGIADERSFYAISSGHKNPVQLQDYARTILFADGEAALRSKAQPEPQLVWRTDPNKPEYASMPLRAGFPFHTAYAASNLGITGVLTGPSIHIVDHSGLADPLASRLQLASRGRPGHEKGLPMAWIIARFGDPGAPVPAGIPAADVEAARRALDCGPLRELQDATTDHLTVGRFVQNIRLSIRLRNFRFPGDPATAEARLCRR